MAVRKRAPGGGRPTKEKEEENLEKAKAEARERNLHRNKVKANTGRKTAGQGKLYDYFGAKKRSEKLNIVLMQLLDLLVKESGKESLSDVDWSQPPSIQLRKAQLQNIKDLLQIVRQMREVIEVVAIDERGDRQNTELSKDNVVLLEQANKLLKSAGIDDEI